MANKLNLALAKLFGLKKKKRKLRKMLGKILKITNFHTKKSRSLASPEKPALVTISECECGLSF